MITARFAHRFASHAFEHGLNALLPLYAVPLLPTFGAPHLLMTWLDVQDHFPLGASIAPVTLDNWLFQPLVAPGTPDEITPHMYSGIVPAWTNNGAAPIGPLAWWLVYGGTGVAGVYEP